MYKIYKLQRFLVKFFKFYNIFKQSINNLQVSQAKTPVYKYTIIFNKKLFHLQSSTWVKSTIYSINDAVCLCEHLFQIFGCDLGSRP